MWVGLSRIIVRTRTSGQHLRGIGYMGFLKLLTVSFIVLVFAAAVCLFLGLIVMGFESVPLVPLERQLKQEDIGRIKKFINQNDPRGFHDGQVKEVTFTQEELNLLLDYALISLGLRVGTRVGLSPEFTMVEGSIALPEKFIGDYLNFTAKIAFDGRKITLNRMGVGKLPVPVFLVNPAMGLGYRLLESSGWFKTVKDAMDSIRTIEPGNKEMTVEFQWDRGIAKRFQNQARDLFVSPSDKERIKFYSGEIARLSHSMDGSSVSLAAYLKPLFLTARERSERDEPAKSENRALIFSLTLYAMGWSDKILTNNPSDSSGFSSGTPALAKALGQRLTLGGRGDLAKHFLVSAAISAGSNSGLSSIVGVFKEIDDSRGGTGFSFADLAADRAGIEFAKLATEKEDMALNLQRFMAQILDEFEFMPSVDHLPEGIMELEFKRRFHDLDSREYALVEAEIAQRISDCKLYKTGLD